MRIYVDFRDLNEACPKDEFPLPITELLIDATTRFGALSFMDGFSGYNQIKMVPKDKELTAFRTPKGMYLLLYSYAFWFKKCRSNVSKSHDKHIQGYTP